MNEENASPDSFSKHPSGDVSENISGTDSERRIIPQGTVAVTIGADSQSDGFYYLLACWGRKMECWLPLTGRFIGDMRAEEVWKALSGVLGAEWFDRDGNLYRPVCAALDVQGDHYPECIEYVRAHRFKCRLHAVRGQGGTKVGGGRSFRILRNVYVDKTTSVTVQNVDTDVGKSQLANMLARKEPGPGYVHLPCGVNGEVAGGWDIEAVAELTSEYRREQNVRGYTITRWYKRMGRANHRLDCFLYSLAALAMSRLKIDECALQRTEAKNVGKKPGKNEKPVTWGAQPANVGDPYIRALQTEQRARAAGQQQPNGMRWGVTNNGSGSFTGVPSGRLIVPGHKRARCCLSGGL